MPRKLRTQKYSQEMMKREVMELREKSHLEFQEMMHAVESAPQPNISKPSKMRKIIKPNLPHEDTSMNSTTVPKHGAGHETAMMPAIAPLAGTTTLISMSRRPQPPAKPRSDRSPSAGGSYKSHTPSQQVPGDKKQAPSTEIQHSGVQSRGHLLSSSSSDESVGPGGSTSSESKQNGRRRVRKKKRSQHSYTKQDQPISSKKHSSKSPTGSLATSSICSLKSATELLDEARHIVAEGAHEAGQQRAPQETAGSESGNTANEIRQRRPGVLHVSEKRISKLMNRQFVDICSSNKEADGRAAPRPVHHLPVLSGGCKIKVACSQSESDSEGVTTADVLEARGGSFTLIQRPQRVSEQASGIHGLTLLATWTPTTNSGEYKTIHHLCTTPASQVLPVELQLASQVCHAQDTLMATPQFLQQRTAFRRLATLSDVPRVVRQGIQVEDVGDTDQTGGVRHLPAHTTDVLADWQRIAEYFVEKPRMMLCGQAAILYDDQLRMFWNPAPPKFSCAPCVIKDKLFPKYQVSPADPGSDNLHSSQHVMMPSVSDQVEEKVLSRKHKSLMDLRTEELVSQSSLGICHDQQPCVWRPLSAPQTTSTSESCLRLQSDFTSVSRELERVGLQGQQRLSAGSATGSATGSVGRVRLQPGQSKPREQRGPQPGRSSARPHRVQTRRGPGLKSARGSVLSQPKCRRKFSCAKMAYVHNKLKELPRTLSRSESLCHLPRTSRVCVEATTLHRCSSLPMVLEQGASTDTLPPQECLPDIWKTWTEEVLLPPENIRTRTDQDASRSCPVSGEKQENQLSKDEVQVEENLDLSDALDAGLTTADLEREVGRLSQAMAQWGRDSAFHLCRRGALYKKLGHLGHALQDLNAAISLEPNLLDAYWHRHSIYLLRSVPDRALPDLNFIIRHNPKHADAFKSRAEIYRMRGETTLAIIDYTQAIKNNPDNAENYFKRAEMYSKSNKITLAMEDYAKTFAIDPARTDALMTHGLHHFHNQAWRVALEDFSLLLTQEPTNSRARTYRGRVFAKLGQFQDAIEDFSLAVHLNPRDWLAFYHRGCVLRKIRPATALRDFSISVLINDGPENVGAFLHRGLLYSHLQQWQQALADFEAVIHMDRTVTVAHINLGLIYMLKMGQNYDAIKMFSNALKVEPTYIRGYICRARAYHNVNNLEKGLKDLTRAIHMRPEDHQLHIMRGKYLCDMEKFDLAKFCIQYAAEMNRALGSSPLQQAAVQCFLGDNAEAMESLQAAARAQGSPSVFTLLGRTQMKAHKFMEAVESFRTALSLLTASEVRLCNAPGASDLFYLTGVCYMARVMQGEDSVLPQALDAFSTAVRINPDHADAFHQRGLCHVRLQQAKSMQDFNRALHINPDSYQVYLSRAALYGAKEQYSKAILNCNEAIRIKPKSIRAYLYRGALKIYLKVYKEAVKDLTMAIKIDATCSLAFYNRGVCYQQLGDYEQALRDYSIVLLLPSQKETELRVLINRALVYTELNDHYGALQDLKAASMKQPEDAVIYHALGVYYHRLGQLPEAVNAHTQALRLNPFLLDAYMGRGNVFMDYGHTQATKQAQRDFLSALHLNPCCSSARIALAYNFQVFGFFQRAWNQFTVAMEMEPRCWTAYEGRAVVSLHMGNADAAFQDINNALKCNPESEQLLTNRGVITQFMGDKPSAMRDYQSAISLNPTFALAFFNAANLFFYNRQFEQACAYYSRAFELEPNDEATVLNRAIARALLRDVPGSLQDFSEALRLSPQSAHVYFNRANLYVSLRRYKAAEKDLTHALELQPDDALLYKLRADVRGHLGLIDQAVEDYRTAVELQDITQHSHPHLFDRAYMFWIQEHIFSEPTCSGYKSTSSQRLQVLDTRAHLLRAYMFWIQEHIFSEPACFGYKSTSSQSLHVLDTDYHGALRFMEL
ncbi:uncharacterized protein ttc6 isoform X2 [Brachyhypopomus gauderio]|uniref:uncharacterized protein ttc6 isoform X2 n=1 Tax=Brachyhypopomus gauderio TaxID=698409 RepID=UPI0040426C8D